MLALLLDIFAPCLHPMRAPKSLAVLSLCTPAACSKPTEPRHLTDVWGHLPDLDFSLIDDVGTSVTGRSFAGKTTLAYFGYTHWPDVCPETMARLMQVLHASGRMRTRRASSSFQSIRRATRPHSCAPTCARSTTNTRSA